MNRYLLALRADIVASNSVTGYETPKWRAARSQPPIVTGDLDEVFRTP
jgi:hypothetical protein